MDNTEVRVFRPYKLLAVIMSIIAFVLMIVSLAGPNWMEVSYHQGEVRTWGLWWDCFTVTGSLTMCVETDWLFACAALVLIGLICMLLASVMGTVGLFTRKRLLYVISGGVSILAIVLQIIALIVYPVKFTEEIKDDKLYRAVTQGFDLDWTYGIAWGAICFMIGAAVLFLVRTETQEVTQAKDNTPPPYYLNYTRA